MSAPAPAPENAFAQVHGHPGEGARAWGLWHAWLPVALLLFAMGFAAGSALRPEGLREGAAGLALLLLAIALAWALRRGQGRLARHRLGALGEQNVAWRLSLLPKTFHIFHGYPYPGTGKGGGRDLDHVVLGPTGCFLVETKNWPAPLEIRDGKLLSAGRAYPGAGLGELAELAARFSDHLRERCGLRVDVVPLLCLANGRIAAAPVRDSGVWLCGLGQVLPLVQSSEHAALPEALLQRLADTLAEPYATTKE